MDDRSLFAAVALTGLAIALTAHAVLHKRDTRTAIAWVGLIWLAPLIGGIAYLLLGINRIRRTAVAARRNLPQIEPPVDGAIVVETTPDAPAMKRLATLVHAVTHERLLAGNTVEVLADGATAYQAMLDAFAQAERSITLSTYIFDNDPTGRGFIDQLARAVDRGVAVRVLVDAAGARYTLPPATTVMQARGIRSAQFFPRKLPLRIMAFNLRNHRKIAVVDGRVGFTGGMNIREGHRMNDGEEAIADMHFRLTGPIVGQLQAVFAVDWSFCTNEILEGDQWFPSLSATGEVLCRGIADGPDEDYDKLTHTLLGALSCAEERVVIVTPYFIPDPTLITSLVIAAMRGIQVDVIVPEKSNLPIVGYASWASYEPLVRRGVRVFLSPPPFDHTKLMLVDDCWSLIGSANWDARSLKLNFEYNVECYDLGLGAQLRALVDAKRTKARRLSLQELQARPRLAKLRDGLVDLASPYL